MKYNNINHRSLYIKNKKGSDLAINMWVVMIIAILVMMVIIGFFTIGSKGFMDNIRSYFSSTNVDSIIKGCNILVDSGNKYDYCCDVKTVKYEIDRVKKEVDYTCYNMTNQSFTNGELKTMDCQGYSCK